MGVLSRFRKKGSSEYDDAYKREYERKRKEYLMKRAKEKARADARKPPKSEVAARYGKKAAGLAWKGTKKVARAGWGDFYRVSEGTSREVGIPARPSRRRAARPASAQPAPYVYVQPQPQQQQPRKARRRPRRSVARRSGTIWDASTWR